MVQENLDASLNSSGKRVAPWPVPGSTPKNAKSVVPAVSKTPLQPKHLNVDHSVQPMGPPPPKKPPTQDQIAHAQVRVAFETEDPDSHSTEEMVGQPRRLCIWRWISSLQEEHACRSGIFPMPPLFI